MILVMSIIPSMTLIPVFGEAEWKSSSAIIRPLTDPLQPTRTFDIQYMILNGTGALQVHDYTFTANTHSKTSGTFQIKIPRNFPYYNGKDGPSNVETYVVIENGGQLTSNQYVKDTSDCFFTYSVPFYMNSTITILSMDTLGLMTPIYGDKVPEHCMSRTMIPEFPYALPILVIGIVSVIVFYGMKFRK